MKYKKQRLFWLVPAILVFVALSVILVNAFDTQSALVTGMVEVTEIDVASKIPGRLDSLFVHEGDLVHEGQVLAVLQSKEIEAKVNQARALVEAAQAQYEMALNGARPEEKEAVQRLYLEAKHQFEFAQKTYERMKQVYQDSVVARQTLDEVEFKYKAAKEQMEAAEAKYQMVVKGARQEQIRAARALLQQAQAAYQEALAYLQETQLTSPINGRVQRILVDAGEMVAAGYPVLTLTKPTDNWVVLQLKEDQLVGLKEGQQLQGFVPALNQTLNFKITYMADMGDFATWRATNQMGDFDLKTFEIHARSTQPTAELKAGMTVRFKLSKP